MDIKMLDYVVMIAKCESISKAAEKLYLTQSGLNQQLLKLERNLGIKLFERDHHHFRITDAGKIYVRNAMEILRIQHNTLMQLSDLKNNIHAEISIGLTHEHGIDLFTAVYPIFVIITLIFDANWQNILYVINISSSKRGNLILGLS